MAGLQLGLMFAGIVIVETIFAWPGIGWYMAQSIPTNDFAAIGAVTLILGALYVVVNALVDILQMVADPRIRRLSVLRRSDDAMPFVPDGLRGPGAVEGDGFTIRPLHVNDAVIDYDAVMTSIDSIRDSYWRAPGWPQDDLTLMQNLIDLAWHTKERQFRTSFAYIPVSLDGSVELGASTSILR